jgi:hypothetical protein
MVSYSMMLISARPARQVMMRRKAGILLLLLLVLLPILASSLLVLQIIPLAHAQAEDEEPMIMSMNRLSSDRSYIVNLLWQVDDASDEMIFDIFIRDSSTNANVAGVRYDISLHKDGQLVPSTEKKDQTSTRQAYPFEEIGQYTVRISDIEDSGENAEFSIQVTPEFPLGLFAAVAAPFTAIAVLQRVYRRR